MAAVAALVESDVDGTSDTKVDEAIDQSISSVWEHGVLKHMNESSAGVKVECEAFDSN